MSEIDIYKNIGQQMISDRERIKELEEKYIKSARKVFEKNNKIMELNDEIQKLKSEIQKLKERINEPTRYIKNNIIAFNEVDMMDIKVILDMLEDK